MTPRHIILQKVRAMITPSDRWAGWSFYLHTSLLRYSGWLFLITSIVIECWYKLSPGSQDRIRTCMRNFLGPSPMARCPLVLLASTNSATWLICVTKLQIHFLISKHFIKFFLYSLKDSNPQPPNPYLGTLIHWAKRAICDPGGIWTHDPNIKSIVL